MHKTLKLLIVLPLCLLFNTLHAQKKYAVIVGINKYYVAPGVVHRSVLRGCINDVLSVKGMLIQRFGFSETNISALTDEAASKKNVVNALNNILAKSREGDAVVFYFSGHGVWMENNNQNILDKDVKKGMNQAMVMSDLYADKLGCLFTDANVKTIFNKFVDKKVIATTIFDCCYSGRLAAMPDFFSQNPYELIDPHLEQKSIDFVEVADSYLFYKESTQDSVDIVALNDSLRIEMGIESPNTRAFNLRDNITISDPIHIARPAERPNSSFLFVSASDEYQKALEITDETGTQHGAFTKALLQTINNSRADLDFKQIFDNVKDLMAKKGYVQTPMHSEDPARLKKNLIGMPVNRTATTVTARSKSSNEKQILIDAGLNDGLTKGNILSVKNAKGTAKIRIIDINRSDATAVVISGSPSVVQKGSLFYRTDNYISSKPVIKLYIPQQNITAAAFDAFFEKQVNPLVNLKNYWDYKNWYKFPASGNILFNLDTKKAGKLAQAYLAGTQTDHFLAFLPIPTYIISGFEKALRSNQNVEIVNNAANADLSLLLNYAKDAKEFVFTWGNINTDRNEGGLLTFNSHNVPTPNMHPSKALMDKLIIDLSNMTQNLVQQKTGRWLNDFPLKKVN